MYMDSEKFENWMERIMERFDRTEKLLERVLKKSNALDGEEVLDNQDLCLLLKVGIRTLQRYRAIGILPYFTISGKVFYRVKMCTSSSATSLPLWRNGLQNGRRRKSGKRKGAGKKACFRKSDISFMISVSGRGLAGS